MNFKEWLDIPKHVFMFFGWVERLFKRYPKTTRFAIYTVSIVLPVACVLYWFCFCYPRQVIYEYLLAVNAKDWPRAHSLLAERGSDNLRIRWVTPDDVRLAYPDFSGHEDCIVERPDKFPSALRILFTNSAVCKTRLTYHVKLKPEDYRNFQVWLNEAMHPNATASVPSLEFRRGMESCLWALIRNPSEFVRLKNAPPDGTIDIRIVNERNWKLSLEGFKWRIYNFRERVSDGLDWTRD